MALLEEKLELEFTVCGVDATNQLSIIAQLERLKQKDVATYEHSIRVGLLGAKIARCLFLNPKALLFTGCLHDIGKVRIDKNLLAKTERFEEKDMEKMREHVNYTYQILESIGYFFSAEVGLRHHKHQQNGYPTRSLPVSTIPFSAETKTLIEFYSMLLALADSYDAATTRTNAWSSTQRSLAPEEAKTVLIKEYPQLGFLVEELYNKKVLS